MGFIHNFGHRSHIEVNVGGRIHIYLAKFRKFANQLKDAGAKLVFICDGHLRSDRVNEWISRRTKEFHKTYAMITRDTDHKFNHSYGCKTFVTNLFKLIEDEKLGEIIVSTYAECDSIVASFAVKHNALAVVGDDSDILIYEGNFRWWQSTKLDIDRCTVRSFDRMKLHRYLNLTPTQMKYMATIAGNDHTRVNVLEFYTHRNIKIDTSFESVANFCRTLTSTDEPDVCSTIAKYMRKDKDVKQAHVDHIRNSIDSYSIFVEDSLLMDRMEKFNGDRCLSYALKNLEIVQIPANFLDYVERNRNSNQTFIDVVVNLYKRLAGIILCDEREQNPKVKIVTKYTLDGKYESKEHNPIYPDDKGQFIYFDTIKSASTNFIVNKNSSFCFIFTDLKSKTSLLLWSLDLDLDLHDKLIQRNVPQKYYAIVLILTFLVEVIEIEHYYQSNVLRFQRLYNKSL